MKLSITATLTEEEVLILATAKGWSSKVTTLVSPTDEMPPVTEERDNPQSAQDFIVCNNGAEIPTWVRKDERIKAFNLTAPTQKIGYWKSVACELCKGDVLLATDPKFFNLF